MFLDHYNNTQYVINPNTPTSITTTSPSTICDRTIIRTANINTIINDPSYPDQLFVSVGGFFEASNISYDNFINTTLDLSCSSNIKLYVNSLNIIEPGQCTITFTLTDLNNNTFTNAQFFTFPLSITSDVIVVPIVQNISPPYVDFSKIKKINMVVVGSVFNLTCEKFEIESVFIKVIQPQFCNNGKIIIKNNGIPGYVYRLTTPNGTTLQNTTGVFYVNQGGYYIYNTNCKIFVNYGLSCAYK